MPPATPEARAPAGFWQRYAAWSLDAVLVAIPTLLLCWPLVVASTPVWDRFGASLSALLGYSLRAMFEGASPLQATLALLGDPVLTATADALRAALWTTLAWPVVLFVVLALCWHVGFERSRWQASPGKRALRLRVVAADGAVMPLARSAARFLAGGVSWLTLNLGHLMAALPPTHRALHDRLSGTRVVATQASLPAWAKAWLWLQAAVLMAGYAWLLLRLDAALQAAFERSLY